MPSAGHRSSTGELFNNMFSVKMRKLSQTCYEIHDSKHILNCSI